MLPPIKGELGFLHVETKVNLKLIKQVYNIVYNVIKVNSFLLWYYAIPTFKIEKDTILPTRLAKEAIPHNHI